MSEQAKNESNRRVQQTLGEIAGSTASRNEVIYRIEAHGKYLRLLDRNQTIKHVMVNYSDAKRVLDNRDGFNPLLEPHQTLTVTGTENDEIVTNRGRFSELDFLARFNRPIRYIPDWSWVYGDVPTRLQRKAVSRYVERVEWLYHEVTDLGLDVDLVPLAKGFNSDHFELTVKTYQQLGINRVAVYAVQTSGLRDLTTRTEQVISTLDPKGVLVIGRGAPHEVAQFPKRVDGIASFRNWKSACELTADGYSSEKLIMWHNMNKQALQNGRTDLQTDITGYLESKQKVTIDG